jgi:UDP-glucose 4-epimerase
MQKILVTGASGFIGQALCAQLIAEKYQVRVLLRSGSDAKIRGNILSNCEGVYCHEANNCDWHKILKNIDVVIHLAARVHIMCDSEQDPLSIFRKINVAWTRELAMAAVVNNVKRFIFMSSCM